jgi:hypothetical protein
MDFVSRVEMQTELFQIIGAGGGWQNNGSGAGNVSNPTIINCILSGNYAGSGGAMFNDGRYFGISNPLLINCILSGNSAGSGGAMLNRGFSET